MDPMGMKQVPGSHPILQVAEMFRPFKKAFSPQELCSGHDLKTTKG